MVDDSLMARLDRLGTAKEIIQLGAVIGGEFSYHLLHAVHPITEQNLQEALRSAIDAELVYVRGIAPDATYQFKHALIRDAAYEALLKSRRKELHWPVAHAIEEKFPSLKESHPEVLARHWSEAGETDLAIGEWTKAGKSAEARNAFKEAEESHQQALALANELPESPERDVRELELRQHVVVMCYITRGYATPETVSASERFVALASKSGDMTQFVNASYRTAFIAFVSGDLPAAYELTDRALGLAVREGNRSLLATLHGLQIFICYWRGDPAGVESHYAKGVEFFDDREYRGARDNRAISAFAYASWNAWALGRTEVARQREALMMALVNQDDAYDLAYSGALAARLRLYMREYQQAEMLAGRALQLSE